MNLTKPTLALRTSPIQPDSRSETKASRSYHAIQVALAARCEPEADFQVQTSRKRSRSLHRQKNKSGPVRLVLLAGLLAALTAMDTASASRVFSILGNSIVVFIDGTQKTCPLDKIPTSAIESHDESALIVSERGYVPISKIEACTEGTPLHTEQIPAGVGVLSDINLSQGIYVALDFVSTAPTAYLATVAKVGSRKNLVSMDGSYIEGKNISYLQKRAFTSSGDAGASMISPDGRYIAVDGNTDCGEDAYPGVWDIEKKTRVISNAKNCSALFHIKR
ncbi:MULTISPECIES: hypothetical protein [unclassified Burkholderia]|uniref:hypothetical protein n=1 Tax=unclassified Burkholderia TaxID=2613784 RepID=UPI0012679BD9|nr:MULTISPECIES: hypothetical protein [unclassified Burkholderia]NIE83520.1 hypothetical protein [Burkholderia sp. Tr-860]NIF62283.1 hypothetical protein [Burkholderia sp. Cy-647]NIF97682.1 hypothetical protein [Burkholderia sp. Ax-1720]